MLSKMLYRAESLPIDAQMTKLISSFGTSAYHIMTGVKRLDKVHNTTVLATVSRNELIHTAYDHQLRFLGHMLRGTSPLARTCSIPANTWQYKTWSSSNKLHGLHPYINRPENQGTHEGIKRLRAGVNFWSRVLIHNHPTRDWEMLCQI